MPVRSTIHQPNFISPRLRNKHVKALPKAELAHDIVREIAKPITHVLDIALLIMRFEIPVIPSKHSTQLTHMEEHHILHPLQSIIRKGLAKNSPFATVHGFINSVVRVIHALDSRESIVKIGLLKAFPVPIDIV